jgi:hypothetical protein
MEKITIDLVAKTDKAVAEVEELKKEIQELNKQVERGNKDTKDGLKGVENASNKTAGGIKKIGGALKAAGIGLAIAAFAKFIEVLNQNQKVTDFFSTTFETLSLAFNDFFSFIDTNAGTIIDYFKGIFEDPVSSLKDFGQAIVDNVIERVKSSLDALGFLGDAVVKVFQGDFAGAAESAKNAGKELFDVVTGVDDSFDKTVETVGNVVTATKDYVKETVNSAKANIELQKTSERARVLNQGIIEDYDRQAEQQRQLRDNEFNTIEERIAANDKLKEVLEEQKQAMLENANAIEAAAQAQYNKNKNEENFLALQEAKNEKAAVEAQITGFMSEQDSNRNALLREKLDLEQSDIDATTERQKAERDFNSEQIENEYLRLQVQKDNLEKEREIELERLETKKKLYKEGTQAYADANNELLAYDEETKRQQAKIETDLAKAKEQEITNALGNIASIVGENSKFGKGIAVVQAIRDTYAGASKALGQGGIFGFVQAAAIIAAGLRNVKQITATKEPTPPSFAKGSGGGSGASPAIPSAPPAFNVVGASATNQLASVISDQTQQPVKAFVVSNDVTTAQELDRNIVSGATIG